MKRRIILSIALVISIVLVSLMGSDSHVQAQRNRRFAGDTGMVPLGPNELLRITVNGGSGTDTMSVQFTRQVYGQPTCNGGVCRSFLIIVEALPVMSVMPDEALSMDIMPMPNSAGVRGMVVTNNQNAKVNIEIVNATTGEILAIFNNVLHDTL